MDTLDAIVQARMKSARLPGKVMLPVLGRPMLSFLVERVRRCCTVRRVIVATSIDPADDVIQAMCDREDIPVFRGSEDDVLDRVYRCAVLFGGEALIRLTADNPLIDPKVTDQVVTFFLNHTDAYDYVSNNHPPSWPDGYEVEVVSLQALALAWREAAQPFQREHVTPYIWDNPRRFRVGNVALPDDSFYRRMRWTLDYPEDYEFVRCVYEVLYPQSPQFEMREILHLLERNLWVQQINAHVQAHVWYEDHRTELQTVDERYFSRDLT